MNEHIEEVDIRYCQDCCATWRGGRCRQLEPDGYCSLTPEHKLEFMRKERHRLKSWTDEYAARLAAR